MFIIKRLSWYLCVDRFNNELEIFIDIETFSKKSGEHVLLEATPFRNNCCNKQQINWACDTESDDLRAKECQDPGVIVFIVVVPFFNIDCDYSGINSHINSQGYQTGDKSWEEVSFFKHFFLFIEEQIRVNAGVVALAVLLCLIILHLTDNGSCTGVCTCEINSGSIWRGFFFATLKLLLLGRGISESHSGGAIILSWFILNILGLCLLPLFLMYCFII